MTVLFADLVGSTGLASGLDPEDMVELLNAVLSRWVDAVHAFEGTVDKFLGDGILALFGAPLLHEDDPRRAVLAGLAIVAQTDALADELAAEGWPRLQVRVGLNTGTVVVGNVGSDARMDYTAIGDVVNVAQRVESAARPGSVYVTAATRRLVAPYFDIVDAGTHELKGVPGGTPLYEVVVDRHVRRTVRGVEGLASPLVGRHREMKLLVDAVERLDRGIGGTVVLMAEAGLGKSRLATETMQRARAAGLPTVVGHAISYGKLVPYLPVIELVRSLDPDADLVGDLSGHGGDDGDAEARHRRTVQTVAGLVARHAPAVVLVEDLHWADEASLDVVTALADTARASGFLLVATTRPSAAEFVEDLPDTDVLPLGPLPRSESGELLTAMLGPSLAPDLAGRLLETSGGNPFYLEELVRDLLDQGRLVRTEAGWKAETNAVISLPPTLEGLLGARIDRLPPGPKRLLRSAAVIGRDVPTSLLEAVEPDLCGHLGVLVEAGFLVPTEGGHRFKHVLGQEAAERAMLKRRRRAVHRRTAEAIESLHADDLEAHAADLGRHFDEAGDTDRARHHLTIAGRRAADGYANDVARALLARALELTEQPEDRIELLAIRAEVLSRVGEHDAEGADVEEMSRIAEVTGTAEHRLIALTARTRYLSSVDHASAPPVAEEALALASTLGHRRERGRLLYLLGTLAMSEYSPERAVPLFQQAAAEFGAEGLAVDEAKARVALIRPIAVVAPDRLRSVSAEAMAAAEAAQDPAVEASLRLQLAGLALDAGDPASAEDHLQVAARHAGDAGDRKMEMGILLRRRYAASTRGDERTADELSLKTMKLAERYREWLPWLFGAMTYVEGLEAREDFATLHGWLTELVDDMGSRLPLHPLSYLHYALGYRTVRWLGGFGEAVDHLLTAQDLADRNAWAPAMVMYRNGIATCLLERGDVGDARRVLDEAARVAADHQTEAVTGAYVEITDTRIALAEGDLERARRGAAGLERWTGPADAVGERQATALLTAELGLVDHRPDDAVEAAATAVWLDDEVRRHARWFTLLQCLDVHTRALTAAGRHVEAAAVGAQARVEAERRLGHLTGTRFASSYRARPEVRRVLDV